MVYTYRMSPQIGRTFVEATDGERPRTIRRTQQEKKLLAGLERILCPEWKLKCGADSTTAENTAL
jgi:hypothetical protein